eukprot:g3383.t1
MDSSSSSSDDDDDDDETCFLIRRKYMHKRENWMSCVRATDAYVFTGSYDENHLCAMWDRREGDVIGIFRGHEKAVTCMCVTNDRQYLITGSRDSKVIQWNISDRERVQTLEGHIDTVYSVDTSGNTIVSGCLSRTILWNMNDGTRMKTIERGHRVMSSIVRLSYDGKSLYGCYFFSPVIRWSAEEGDALVTYEGGHTDRVTSLVVTRDDSMLITGSSDNTCVLWDVPSGVWMKKFQRHENCVTSVALSPCERFFASASQDKTTILWPITTDAKATVFREHVQTVHDVTFASRGTLVTCSYDGTAIEYDVSSLITDTRDRVTFLLCVPMLGDWGSGRKRLPANAFSKSQAKAALKNLRLGKGQTARCKECVERAETAKRIAATETENESSSVSEANVSLICAMCKRSLASKEFSKTQLAKDAKRKCRSCTTTLQRKQEEAAAARTREERSSTGKSALARACAETAAEATAVTGIRPTRLGRGRGRWRGRGRGRWRRGRSKP